MEAPSSGTTSKVATAPPLSELTNRVQIVGRDVVLTTMVESASIETCHCGCVMIEVEELMLRAECDTNDMISDDDSNN